MMFVINGTECGWDKNMHDMVKLGIVLEIICGTNYWTYNLFINITNKVGTVNCRVCVRKIFDLGALFSVTVFIHHLCLRMEF